MTKVSTLEAEELRGALSQHREQIHQEARQGGLHLAAERKDRQLVVEAPVLPKNQKQMRRQRSKIVSIKK